MPSRLRQSAEGLQLLPHPLVNDDRREALRLTTTPREACAERFGGIGRGWFGRGRGGALRGGHGDQVRPRNHNI